MATDFICILKSSGGDFTDWAAWEDAMDANYHSVGGGQIASARWRVYSLGGVTGTVAASNVLVGQTNGYTATCVLRTATQILVVHDTDGETFANSEVLQVSEGNSVTVSASGGSGDTCNAVLEVDGAVEVSTVLAFAGWATGSGNRAIVRSKGAAKRSSSSAVRFGSAVGRVTYTGTSSAISIGEDYVDIEDIDIERTDTTAAYHCITVAGIAASNAINIRRCVLKGASSGSGRCLYVNDADAVVTADNCVMYSSTNTRMVQNAAGTVNLRYCTMYSANAGNSGAITNGTSATMAVTNCYGNNTGTSTAFPDAGTLTLVDVAASDASGSEDGLDNLAASNQFTALTSGSEDFTLLSTADLIDACEAIDGLTDDIFGATRTSPDIGAVEYATGATPKTADGATTLGSLTIAGEATRTVTSDGAVTLGAITLAGTGVKGIPASGAFTLGSVDLDGATVREITATGALTFGGLDILGRTVNYCTGAFSLGALDLDGSGVRVVDSSGAFTLGEMVIAGGLLSPPTELFCNNSDTGAQSGETNPTGITDLTPAFSANVTKLDSDITHVQIQVSGEDDDTFTDPLSWDSGWLELTSAIATTDTDAKMRTEDIVYGQGA